MDIKPPKGWRSPTRTTEPKVSAQVNLNSPPVKSEVSIQDSPAKALPLGDVQLDLPETATQPRPKRSFGRSPKFWIFFSVGIILIACLIGAFLWYKWAVAPVSNDPTKREFTVSSGESPAGIAKRLEEQQLIKSAFAFELYTRFYGDTSKLKAGIYRLASSQSLVEIVAALVKGQDSVYNVFIPPGLTLKQLADPAVKGSFATQGFSQEEIQSAFTATYDALLLKDKPEGASLEGYIFPETFQVKVGDSLKSVLGRSFDELYSRLEKDGFLGKFAEKKLSIHQALTLGSIIQKETSDPSIQPQVAQVFLSRIQVGMTLGSDVTFIYAARQMGVQPVPELDSPYNTRIHTGFPPGPIATMNYSALKAVADPAQGDYLFFVAGDDGKVYFSRSDAEHQQKVQQYCQKLCSEPL